MFDPVPNPRRLSIDRSGSSGASIARRNTAIEIVVLGNSGSLLETPPQEEWRDSLYSIGTNRILRTGIDGRQYRPSLTVVSDRRVVETDPDVATCPDIVCPSWMQAEGIIRSPLRIYPFAPFTPQARFPSLIDEGLLQIGNVVFEAIQLAVLTAPVRVIVLGCECRWPRNGKPSHFYNVRTIEKSLRPFETSDDSLPWYRLGEWAKEHGVEIVNGSPWASQSGILPFPTVDASLVLQGTPR